MDTILFLPVRKTLKSKGGWGKSVNDVILIVLRDQKIPYYNACVRNTYFLKHKKSDV